MSLSKMSFKMQFIDQCIVIIVCKRNNTKLQTTASYAKEKTFHYIQRLVNKCTHTCFVLNKNVKVRVRSLYFLLQPTSSFNWLTTGLNKIKGFHYTYIIYIYTYIYMYICVCVYICMYVCICVYTPVPTKSPPVSEALGTCSKKWTWSHPGITADG